MRGQSVNSKLQILNFVVVLSACTQRSLPSEPSSVPPSSIRSAQDATVKVTWSGDAAVISWSCLVARPTSSWFTSSGSDPSCAVASLIRPASSRPAAVSSPAVSSPTNLAATVVASTVTVTWSAPGGDPVVSYILEAGSAPGLSDLVISDLGGPATSLVATGVSPGTYYVRVRARSVTGTGAPSNEITVTVGAGSCTTPPGTPSNLVASSNGSTVSLTWAAPSTGCAPTTYVIEAGSATTRSDLANFRTNNTAISFTANGVANGSYYVRVRAANAAGAGAASNETLLTVGSAAPGTLLELIQRFTYRAQSGVVPVGSTFSQAFSQQHADHANLVWSYFSVFFGRSPGNHTELYYTNDMSLYAQLFSFCPTEIIAGARQLTACWDSTQGFWRWFIVPYVTPDFGTQQHELSHTFMQTVYPVGEDYVWIKEGTGMYWESGAFAGSSLLVTTPIPYLTVGFRRAHDSGRQIPLSTLMYYRRAAFYGSPDPTVVYSQAGMLIFYLMNAYPAVMGDMFAGFKAGSPSAYVPGAIGTNDQLIAFLTSRTGLTLAQLDAAYTAFALRY